MGKTERMGNAARVCHRLRSATFVFSSRDTVLRPHFHRHSNDLVALLAQQITGDAGVHSTAHAQQNTLFPSQTHARKIGESALLVNCGSHPLPGLVSPIGYQMHAASSPCRIPASRHGTPV